jgi:enoyl-CoA hydratase/carnithine racemase
MSIIEIEDANGVRLIAFNRPERRNAFNVDLYTAVAEAINQAEANASLGAVVMTGRGTAFTAGQDLAEMALLATGQAPEGAGLGFIRLLEAATTMTKPLFAAVNGVGMGMGFTILAHCDFVLIDEEARLRVPFAELGVPPEAASSYLFPKLMGWQQAARVLLASEWVTADEAVAMGIALKTCPAGTVLNDTIELAERVASFPAQAVTEIKRLMTEPHREAIAAALARENEAFSRLLGSATTVDALDRFNSGH